jgi:hypothetical protein
VCLEGLAMSENDASSSSEHKLSAKASKAKMENRFKGWLEIIFEHRRESQVTPDQAMQILDEMLRSWILGSADPEKSSTATHRLPSRVDMASFSRTIHHYAVDLYYDTYFPRRPGWKVNPEGALPPTRTNISIKSSSWPKRECTQRG